MSLRTRLERAAVFGLLRLPEGALRKLAGKPIVEDGFTLDHRVQLAIRVHGASGRPALETLEPPAARSEYLRSLSLLAEAARPMAKVEDTTADGVPVRIYTPNGAPEEAGILVYLHGGGGVIGDLDACDAPCRTLADESGCVVVSVDYRLGPEQPFPAALEDAHTAYAWAIDNARRLGGHPDRVGIGGDSYGGTMSALLAQDALTSNVPMPALQLLFYPCTDFSREGGSRDTFAKGYLLDRTLMDWFRDRSFSDLDGRRRASPLLRGPFAGLGPTVIMTAGFDPLRDEAKDYAEALAAAGVTTHYRCYEHVVHAFISFASVVPEAREGLADAAAWMKTYLSPK